MKISAYSRCTQREGFAAELVINHLKSDVKYGPDNGFALLSDNELQIFCAGPGKTLEHRGLKTYNHACAGHGGWAFDAQDSTFVCCVVFLHYNTPAKVREQLGTADPSSPAAIFTVRGEALWERYTALQAAMNSATKAQHGRAPHVWQRTGHKEIAIDFCLTFA
jgi:hypothetical protein